MQLIDMPMDASMTYLYPWIFLSMDIPVVASMNMTMNIIKNMILGGTDLDPLSQNIKQDMKRIGTLVKRTCENN